MPAITACAATVQISYAATQLQAVANGRHLDIVRGLSEAPEVRGGDLIVPGLAGRITRNRINDIVQIELRGFVTNDPTVAGSLLASYRTQVRAWRTLFSPTRTPAALVCWLEDGATATITARPLNVIWAEQVQSLIATVSVELEGYGDWVYS